MKNASHLFQDSIIQSLKTFEILKEIPLAFNFYFYVWKLHRKTYNMSQEDLPVHISEIIKELYIITL